MKSILVGIVLFMFAAVAAGGQKAVDIGAGFSQNSSKTIYPVYSISFDFLKARGFHEISIDFYSFSIKNGLIKDANVGFGALYSYLFNLPINHVYWGPTVGVSTYVFNKTNSFINSGGYPDETVTSVAGSYFTGLNTCYILGENYIRLKLQDRLLFGFGASNGGSLYFDFLNNLSLSFQIVF